MIRKSPTMMATTLLIAACATSAAAQLSSLGRAAKRSTPDGAQVVQLKLHAAAEPDPALKYRLLPPVLDQTAGNAADAYKELIQKLGPRASRSEADQEYIRLDELPLEQLPGDDVRELLSRYPMDELRRAARMEQCDWKLRIREEGLNMKLPSLGALRFLARLVSLQARMHVAEGDYAKAIDSLQTGFALARHTAEGPTLINGLVGIAIGQLMLNEVTYLSQAPGAPNLYWALATLPRPLINLDRAVEWEGAMIFAQIPALREVRSEGMSAERWNEVSSSLITEFMSMVNQAQRPEQIKHAAVAAFCLKYYAPAKAYLADHGRTAEQIEAMPVTKAVAIYFVADHEYWRDESRKWAALPYWQAHKGLSRTQRRMKELPQDVGPITRILAPALGRAYLIAANSSRRVAALQTIEAIRMHAATGDGTLPASLSAITVVPTPINQVTGKAFDYTVDGNHATLRAMAPPGVGGRMTTVFEITLVQD